MNETIKSIKDIIIRDLDRLSKEISSYKDEANLWKLSGEVNNTAGNLCLHLCGNLKNFIGATIGKDGFVRNRTKEFDLKNVAVSDLIQNINETKAAVNSALDNFDDSLLNEAYPIEVFGKPITHVFFLIHLSGHLNYHLGQISYQRRLVDCA